jgi:DNA-directed RNA polymerase specialized sigma24 family protein
MTSDSLAACGMDEALRSLDPAHRAALIRVHYHDESISEFALREQLSEAEAKARLHDALHALRHAVADRDAPE